jgi:hypothetical protein
MRKTLFSLVFAVGAGTAFGALPYTDPDYRPNPLMKVIDFVRPRNSFENHIKSLSELTGIKITIDRAGLQKHGISKNTSFEAIFCNREIIGTVYCLIEKIDNQDRLTVRQEEDGSLTITSK